MFLLLEMELEWTSMFIFLNNSTFGESVTITQMNCSNIAPDRETCL